MTSPLAATFLVKFCRSDPIFFKIGSLVASHSYRRTQRGSGPLRSTGRQILIDRQTIDRLVVEHLPVALRVARRLSGDVEIAEEIVQEAICRILQRWRSYRGEAAFRTWMIQVVVNIGRDRRRRERSHEVATEQLVSPTLEPYEQLTADELRQQIRAAIDDLPDRQREVALLSFGEGFGARDIADILDVTVANVQTCLHLARQRIAQAIGIEHLLQKRMTR